ncbi:MAG: hypothetical protein ACMXYK_02785 [Candidatus Woesearchaeota archaeon]
MKGQLAIELLIFIGIVVISTLLFLRITQERTTISFDERTFWENQEIGVFGVQVTNVTNIYLQNNHRVPITINHVYFNGINLNVTNISASKTLQAKQKGWFQSEFKEFLPEISIIINYTIFGEYIIFEPVTTYEGLKN